LDDVLAGDLGSLAALLGDRARAAMLTTLIGGQALTASELAQAALVFSAVGERAPFRGFESHRRQPSRVSRLRF
jgi:hypothetical protein